MTAAIDLRFDFSHLLVGDDEEVAGAAGRIKYANPCKALPEILEFSGVVSSFRQLLPKIVKEERVEDFEDVRHTGVVHP